MRYSGIALIVSILFLLSGATAGYYAILSAEAASTPTEATAAAATISTLTFIALGLLLIGSLMIFITPENLIAATVMNNGLSPLVDDIELIIRNLDSRVEILHNPSITLGSDPEILLILRTKGKKIRGTKDPQKVEKPSWDDSSKALVPPGLELMKLYQKVLKRDFLGTDIERLSGLLERAIVTELQLASAFSLTAQPGGQIETTWRGSVIDHLIQPKSDDPLSDGLTSLCSLCSSVACALARCTGNSVKIEESKLLETRKTVTTTFLIGGTEP